MSLSVTESQKIHLRFGLRIKSKNIYKVSLAIPYIVGIQYILIHSSVSIKNYYIIYPYGCSLDSSERTKIPSLLLPKGRRMTFHSEEIISSQNSEQ